MPANHPAQLHEEMNATLDAIKLDETDASCDHLMQIFERIDCLPLEGAAEACTKFDAFIAQVKILVGEESGLDFAGAEAAALAIRSGLTAAAKWC
jgi:hypothetical protein